ncbi:MAG: hypothetical protein ACR2HV_06675 [Acidimicrobiales bacterium]
MGEPGRVQAVGEWWTGLSQAWRANVVLYGLATISLVALVAQLVAGGGDPPTGVEVASRGPNAAPTSRPLVTVGPTTTTVPGAPASPDTTAVPTPTPVTAPDTPPSPVPISVDPLPPNEETTVPTAPACRNSFDPACGSFFWDPQPGSNQPINVSVTMSPTDPAPGEPVNFTVTVTDPDHEVSQNCAVIDYGDGVVDQRPCRSFECQAAFGPWDTPAKRTGREVYTFIRPYAAGNWVARFTFRTDRDLCRDPYGNEGTGQINVAA